MVAATNNLNIFRDRISSQGQDLIPKSYHCQIKFISGLYFIFICFCISIQVSELLVITYRPTVRVSTISKSIPNSRNSKSLSIDFSELYYKDSLLVGRDLYEPIFGKANERPNQRLYHFSWLRYSGKLTEN